MVTSGPAVRGANECGHLFSRRGCSFIKVASQVLKMNAFGAFLAVFNSHQRDRNIACGDLGYQLDRGQMTKVIPADPFNRDDGAAFILSE